MESPKAESLRSHEHNTALSRKLSARKCIGEILECCESNDKKGIYANQRCKKGFEFWVWGKMTREQLEKI